MLQIDTLKDGDKYIRFIDAIIREYHTGDKLNANTCYLYTGEKAVGEEDISYLIEQLSKKAYPDS